MIFLFAFFWEIQTKVQEIGVSTFANGSEILKVAQLGFGNRPKVSFRFPRCIANDLTTRVDPWLNVLIFPMMLVGGKFRLDGDVSASLIENIEMFSVAWSVWRPNDYKPVKILAKIVADDYRPDNNKLITAFSGGLDSSYTAYKYKNHLNGRKMYDLDKSVFVLGADIPLSRREKYNLAFKKAKKMTDDLGIQLISVETNYKEYNGIQWEWEYFSVVSGILGFFARTYATTAASDCDFRYYHVPWGSNPISDKFLSSDTCRFIADGYEHTRTERAGLLKDWKVGIENLRVCWRNVDQSENCGFCEKCVRTKLNFLAHGVVHLPCMPWDFSLNDLKDGIMKTEGNVELIDEILVYGKKHKSLTPGIVSALEKKTKEWHQKFSKRVKILTGENLKLKKRKRDNER